MSCSQSLSRFPVARRTRSLPANADIHSSATASFYLCSASLFFRRCEWPGGGQIVSWRSNGRSGSAANLDVLFGPDGEPLSWFVQYTTENWRRAAPKLEVLLDLVEERANLRVVLEQIKRRPDSLARLPSGEVRILWTNGGALSEFRRHVLVLNPAGECDRVVSPTAYGSWGVFSGENVDFEATSSLERKP